MSDQIVSDVATLEAAYGVPSEGAVIKVADHVTPVYRRWIEASRFVVLTTVGPEGTDGSPRGDEGPVVRIVDAKTLHLPDWRGNNRMDSLRNIVRDGRVSLMFMVPGATDVMRINGRAVVKTGDICETFTQHGKHPRSVVEINVAEVYGQCSRAVMRAGIWSGEDESGPLPSFGEILAEAKAGFDGEAYDTAWPDRAKASMW